MARTRNIKPGFFKNEILAEIDPLGRLLFAGLWTIADRAGRLEDRPKKIKAELLPYDDCNVDTLLQELHDRGFILRYKAGGVGYIQIVSWDKHQNPHHKEPESTIPAPAVCAEEQGQLDAVLEYTIDQPQTSPRQDLDLSKTSTELSQEQPCTSRANHLNLITNHLNLTTNHLNLGNNIVPPAGETPPEGPKQDQLGRKCKFESEHMELAERLKYRILEHKPDARLPNNLASWANTIRLMIEQDARSPDRIAAVIDWCQKDQFWQKNILSADNLRKHFDRMEMQIGQDKRQIKSGGVVTDQVSRVLTKFYTGGG